MSLSVKFSAASCREVIFKTSSKRPRNTCNPQNLKKNNKTFPKKFNKIKERLSTFNTWPPQMTQDPTELAQSGFIYTGKGDETICYVCKTKIMNWEYGEIVNESHLLRNPNCPIAKKKKNML